ncbi:MAG: GHKL domain-containing protein [Melioribacter sp.]|nr:GHKL domain-containing protein [Melioribacter sp.]
MKIFGRGFLVRKKIIYIFLLAILVPSFIVGYLSLSTLVTRRDAVEKILRSNLWNSCETALKSFETKLIEHEKEVLKAENYSLLNQNYTNFSIDSIKTKGQAFLLNDNYQIIIPRTGVDDILTFQLKQSAPNDNLSQDFKNAESFEFTEKDFKQASELYKKCSVSGVSELDRATALEGLGRCFLSLKEYREANKIYDELITKYGIIRNKAGHPYSIVAAYQLSELEQLLGHKELSIQILFDLYKKIRNGDWLLGPSVFNFFISDLESILNEKLTNKLQEMQRSYLALKRKEAPYNQALLFTDLLKNEIIPRIKEKSSNSNMVEETSPDRFLVTRRDSNSYLISYCISRNQQTKKKFYSAYCWGLKYFIDKILSQTLDKIRTESGLVIQAIDEDGRNLMSGKKELISQASLSLAFRQFEVPWKLLISQPPYSELESTALRENILYGLLISFIIILMILGAIMIVRDIARETETTRLRTEFVHNVSHELKTPLTLVRLYGETLQRKGDLNENEKLQAYEIITKESERLSHLIDNVLDFSRIEMGKKEFNIRKGNLSKVVRDTLDSYLYHLKKKGFKINAEISSEIPEMDFDSEAIASVLINLLSNAIKFSADRKEVTVKLFRDNDSAVLQVEDKGIGISPEDTSKIFQRFYRVKNKFTSDSSGSGLGLTLVMHIIEAHGGTVKVESKLGEGSTFSIILPISISN